MIIPLNSDPSCSQPQRPDRGTGLVQAELEEPNNEKYCRGLWITKKTVCQADANLSLYGVPSCYMAPVSSFLQLAQTTIPRGLALSLRNLLLVGRL
jgi:hypothetical protein